MSSNPRPIPPADLASAVTLASRTSVRAAIEEARQAQAGDLVE